MKTSTRLDAVVFLCSASLVGVLAISNSAGADQKTLPGSACTWMWEDFLGNPIDRPTYPLQGHVRNPDSSYPQAFSCPIYRDDLGGDDGDIESLEVYVHDNTDSANIQCRLYHNDGDSSSYVYGSADTSVDGYDTLTPTVPGTAYIVEGLYNIYCVVPGLDGTSASSIRAYWWNE